MLKIVGDSKDKINKLREDFSQMHFKVDALNLVVNTLVTKDEYEVKENHINDKIGIVSLCWFALANPMNLSLKFGHNQAT